jgi:hypothetical protein
MIRRRGARSGPELLGSCGAGVGTQGHQDPLDDQASPCQACRVPCPVLEDTARYLADGVSRTWAGISAAIASRRHELDEVLDRLAGVGGSPVDPARPIRTLVMSPHEPERAALGRRMAADPRFDLVGEASSPGEVVPVTAAALPDLVLVHLPELAAQPLAELADVGRWSPSTVVVVVSGLDAARVADLLVTSGVPDDWPRREPSRSGARAPGRGRPGGPGPTGGHAGADGSDRRRSIIQEAMRQIGVPMRRPR